MGAERPAAFADARCLTASEAANYCRLTSSGFRAWVARGTLPPPLPGTRRWDRHAIDAALDRLSGLEKPDAGQPNDDFDRWMREHGQG